MYTCGAMAQETVGSSDWERFDWQETPYPGVFLFKLSEGFDPENPNIPIFSSFALKVNPGSRIPRHFHKREPNWREQINFQGAGDFEILRADGSEKASDKLLVITIKSYEVFGVKNRGLSPLFFTSTMKPGFTGYQEIEEVNDQDADSRAADT
jgi:hypothetical protein